MGFYDQHDDNQARRRSPIVLVSIISSIIGGFIVLFLMPLLYQNDIITSPSRTLSEAAGPMVTTSVKVNSDITAAVKQANPAVVGVINLKSSGDPLNPEPVQQGTGSGVIYEKVAGKAHIVTNFHVIENSNEIRVVIPTANNTSKTVTAKILGSDRITDLAVLEIPDTYVTTVVPLGNSDVIVAGEPAIAIGNPLGLGQSVTVGVISSPRRAIDVTENMATDVIQTDAAINPGNSGGALLNAAGQLIGINSLKIAESGVEGLGFAIPINDARPIMNDLVLDGHVPRPYLGIGYTDLSQLPQNIWNNLGLPPSVEGGIAITDIDPGTPAAMAGLRVRDVIVALDQQKIYSGSELRKYLYKHKAIGQKLTITFYRNGQKKTTTLTLAEAPKSLGE